MHITGISTYVLHLSAWGKAQINFVLHSDDHPRFPADKLLGLVSIRTPVVVNGG